MRMWDDGCEKGKILIFCRMSPNIANIIFLCGSVGHLRHLSDMQDAIVLCDVIVP